MNNQNQNMTNQANQNQYQNYKKTPEYSNPNQSKNFPKENSFPKN